MEEDDEGPSESDYIWAITRVAVAQICQSMGFKLAQNSALNVLTDIAGRYLRAIAKSAASSANSTGRSQSNLFDIIGALEDLGSVQGFIGCSETNVHCVLSSSSLLIELQRFLKYIDETPFAKPLPKKVVCDWNMAARGGGGGGERRFGFVPRWLPAMPVIVEGGPKPGEEEGKGEEFELEENGGKVKDEMRSGVFRKRVLCCNEWNSGNEDEVGKKKVILRFKKRLK